MKTALDLPAIYRKISFLNLSVPAAWPILNAMIGFRVWKPRQK